MDAPLRIEGRAKGRVEDVRSELGPAGPFSAAISTRRGAGGSPLRGHARLAGRRPRARARRAGASAFGPDGPPGRGRTANGDAAPSSCAPTSKGTRAKRADAPAADDARRRRRTRTMGLDARYHALLDTRATSAMGTLRSARLRVDGTARGASTPTWRASWTAASRCAAGGNQAGRVSGRCAREAPRPRQLEANGDALSLSASLAATGSVIDSLPLEGRADDLRRLASKAAGRPSCPSSRAAGFGARRERRLVEASPGTA